MPQCHTAPGVHKHALVVRTAMGLKAIHETDVSAQILGGSREYSSGNAAHLCFSCRLPMQDTRKSSIFITKRETIRRMRCLRMRVERDLLEPEFKI